MTDTRPSVSTTPTTDTATKAPWWVDAVVYQVYPRSFSDANGDGEGDLPGITERLPYLASLGVDAIWLSPFYPSPMADSGYDVADPRDVDPRFGSLADATRMIDAAHAAGLRVIIDVVPNHVSREHRWFVDALTSAPGSAARQRFHFRDGRGSAGELPPNNWQSVFTGSAWSRITEPDGTPGQWYLHLFDSSQPDLNWDNPEVRADMLETLRFWLDRGVDGFRVDVALGLAKDSTYADHHDPVGLVDALRLDLADGRPGSVERRELVANSPTFDRDEVHDIYREWRVVLDSYPGDRMSVAEAWVHPPERALSYVRGDTLHQIFNFDYLVAPWNARALRDIIERSLATLEPVGALPTWALCNHDTPRVVTRLGGGPGGRARARALALLTHALPGSVYVYQGEELGLEDVDLADDARQDPVWFRSSGTQLGRDGGRVPLPWEGATPSYGFSQAASTWLPQPSTWVGMTARDQEGDETSTLAQYRAALGLRRTHPGLRPGAPMRFLDTRGGVIAFERGAGLVCAANTTGRTLSVPIAGVIVLASGPGAEVRTRRGEELLFLPPDTCAWVQT